MELIITSLANYQMEWVHLPTLQPQQDNQLTNQTSMLLVITNTLLWIGLYDELIAIIPLTSNQLSLAHLVQFDTYIKQKVIESVPTHTLKKQKCTK